MDWRALRAQLVAHYYWRLLRQVVRQVLSFGRDQIVGLLIVLLILLAQIHYGLVSRDAVRVNELAVLWPYLALLGGYTLYEAVRAPYVLDKKRQARIDELERLIEAKPVEPIERAAATRPQDPCPIQLTGIGIEKISRKSTEDPAIYLGGPQTPLVSVAYLARFVYESPGIHSVRAKIDFENKRNKNLATSFPANWIAFDTPDITCGQKDERFLILAMADANQPRKWYWLEDTRRDDYVGGMLVRRELPPHVRHLSIELTIDNTRVLHFGIGVDFDNLSAVRDEQRDDPQR